MTSPHIFILGAGPGGYVAAIRAARLGAKVTLAEQENVGGTCLNHGCIPSKLMKTTAQLLNRFRHADSFGVMVDGSVGFDLTQWQSRKKTLINTQIKGIETLLKQNQITYLKGTGQILSPKQARVRTDQGETTVNFDALILATGARPLELPNIPIDGHRILSSREILSLKELPQSLVIVGGGVIGCEFAFMLSQLGVGVTLVEAENRLLPLDGIDTDISALLIREMKKQRIKVYLHYHVQGVDDAGTQLAISIQNQAKQSSASQQPPPEVLMADKLLIAIGRKPNTTPIPLKTLGLQKDNRGWIIADEQMRTNIPSIYAIGDLLGPEKQMLAHVASAEGLIAVETIMGKDAQMNYNAIPNGIFTMPEAAAVGLTENQAHKLHKNNVRVDHVLFRSLGKSHVIGEIAGQVKIVSQKDSGKVLGVHIVGPSATELIAEGTLAVQQGISVSELADTIHVHPTLSEVVMETALKASDKPVHG